MYEINKSFKKLMLKEIQEALTVDRLGNDAHRQASRVQAHIFGSSLEIHIEFYRT